MRQLAVGPSKSTSSGYSASRGGGVMIRITLQYIWTLSESMETLARLDHTKSIGKVDLMFAAFEAKNALEALFSGSVFAGTLRSARPLAEALRAELQKATEGSDLEGDSKATDVWALKRAYEAFKIAFLAELGTFPTYFVSQKGSHDTLTLLDDPARMFPDDLEKKVPEAMFDVGEAGKALCYETATASGFHLFRAAECVLRRYYSHVTGRRSEISLCT